CARERSCGLDSW
nr:immunoglobulin heavy chain junction region [Macaca mulatta]